jgi:hypothetical protein
MNWKIGPSGRMSEYRESLMAFEKAVAFRAYNSDLILSGWIAHVLG